MEQLHALLKEKLEGKLAKVEVAYGEITIHVKASLLLDVAYILISDDALAFDQLIDVCGIDYLNYGVAEWETSGGFSRGVQARGAEHFTFDQPVDASEFEGSRFAAVYHFLSVINNHRLRMIVACDDNDFPTVDSVVEIWPSADWFEREAFDLYGIMFQGHPDLRRILTDYGFVGHPFRKDFPLIGHVEMRYDEEKQRVLYEPVTIEPRVLVPRVVREQQDVVEGED